MTRVTGGAYREGTVLVGTTKRHPGVIEILGATAMKYRIRVAGGQHNAKKEIYLSRPIVESFYRVVQTPKGDTR
jgi:hypothetical protein